MKHLLLTAAVTLLLGLTGCQTTGDTNPNPVPTAQSQQPHKTDECVDHEGYACEKLSTEIDGLPVWTIIPK